MTLTNQTFFSQEEGWPLPEKTLEEDHRCCKKALHPKHYAEVLATAPLAQSLLECDICVQFFFVIERTRDLIYLKFGIK